MGVPKVKSASAFSVARPNNRTNVSRIAFFILVPFQNVVNYTGNHAQIYLDYTYTYEDIAD